MFNSLKASINKILHFSRDSEKFIFKSIIISDKEISTFIVSIIAAQIFILVIGFLFINEKEVFFQIVRIFDLSVIISSLIFFISSILNIYFSELFLLF